MVISPFDFSYSVQRLDEIHFFDVYFTLAIAAFLQDGESKCQIKSRIITHFGYQVGGEYRSCHTDKKLLFLLHWPSSKYDIEK